MKNKLENILFYASKNVNPPKKGLENILANLPVTNYDNERYNYVMGMKIALPLGIVALALITFIFIGNSGKNNKVAELPATVTKENVGSSLDKIDTSVSTSIDQLDQNLKEVDQEDTSEGSDSL